MERINSRAADPVTILAVRILHKLCSREVRYNDQYALVYAEPMCMRQLYRAMNHHRYGELWQVPAALVAHRRQKMRRRRPQNEWSKVNVLGQPPSLDYVPGDPLGER